MKKKAYGLAAIGLLALVGCGPEGGSSERLRPISSADSYDRDDLASQCIQFYCGERVQLCRQTAGCNEYGDCVPRCLEEESSYSVCSWQCRAATSSMGARTFEEGLWCVMAACEDFDYCPMGYGMPLNGGTGCCPYTSPYWCGTTCGMNYCP